MTRCGCPASSRRRHRRVLTTGRGSVLGCKPAPSLKLATTTELYDRMTDDMDFNWLGARRQRHGSELGDALFQEILTVASGRRTRGARS